MLLVKPCVPNVRVAAFWGTPLILVLRFQFAFSISAQFFRRGVLGSSSRLVCDSNFCTQAKKCRMFDEFATSGFVAKIWQDFAIVRLQMFTEFAGIERNLNSR